MSKLKDLTGQTFGMLTVIGRGEDYVSPTSGKKSQDGCADVNVGKSLYVKRLLYEMARLKAAGVYRKGSQQSA